MEEKTDLFHIFQKAEEGSINGIYKISFSDLKREQTKPPNSKN